MYLNHNDMLNKSDNKITSYYKYSFLTKLLLIESKCKHVTKKHMI